MVIPGAVAEVAALAGVMADMIGSQTSGIGIDRGVTTTAESGMQGTVAGTGTAPVIQRIGGRVIGGLVSVIDGRMTGNGEKLLINITGRVQRIKVSAI